MIGVTMRVEHHQHINEYRDALDQRWYLFLRACGLFPVLIPNHNTSMALLSEMNLSGIILSGGNSLSTLGGDSPQRDELEKTLLDYAVYEKKPVLGVCRGMQMMQAYFDVSLFPVANHVAVRHNVRFAAGPDRNVNSYHEYGARDSSESLTIDARAEDGVIEAVSHVSLPIRGIMWHPEREHIFSEEDIRLFKDHFQS
ncbi:gamma-glutamyl-gamma-aminobutyrate hydrolase family protein [Legionella spiritensis]|uniref:gamma-glutamyl-gamma-aminobutyrate hydrolase family protein n=1 Tax=Legionella spiritensis TaxID=452 RepID=UPI002378CB1E|nr:gamma-glutamyl-gamma-aminobutyrate hydrolase family protein [Legionella spiritensis]